MATKKADSGSSEDRLPFGRINYILLAVALVVIVIGYILLGQGSITLSPILLVIGYVVLIPLAIIVRAKADSDDSDAEAPEA